jgi:anti-anti-sigma regulatory factor
MTVVPATGQRPAYVVVAFDDETTGPGRDLSSRLSALLDDGVSTVLIDVTRLRAMSSDTVGALLSARREASRRGARVLLKASGRSAALVSRSALSGLFEVTPTGAPVSMWRHP